MNRTKFSLLSLAVFLLVVSCKTYTVPVDSFREQMIGETSENMKKVQVNNPLFYSNIRYNSNNIRRIIVTDKDGNTTYLNNSPSIEMRVTQMNGKRNTFYFDTVVLENDTLKAGKSRFAKNWRSEIPMDSIAKIEIQDGGKKFNYRD